jgi:HCO3- transporter family
MSLISAREVAAETSAEATTSAANNIHDPTTVQEATTESDHDDPPLFQFLTGMRQDLAARLPIYKDDWGRPNNIFTVLNATCFAFVVQLIPALIFAELMDRETEGNLATAEV